MITLLVSPEDAGRLAMASTEGKIQLALRNTVDTMRVEPPVVLEANLFSGGHPRHQSTLVRLGSLLRLRCRLRRT